MGLIKTAIMTGGGLYAVNKIAKTAERRYDSRPQQAASNNQYAARSNDQQDARTFRFPSDSQQDPQSRQAQPQYQSRDMYNDSRNEYPPQQPYYLANDNAYGPLPHGYLENSSSQRAYPWEVPTREYMPASPPYAPRQQMGFVEHEDQAYDQPQRRSPRQPVGYVVPEDRDYDQPQQRSGGTPLPAFAQQALSMAMAAGAQGKRGKKGDGNAKGAELLAGLFSK